MATVLQVQRLQGRPGGDCFWYHRGGAIAALNKDLSDSKPQVTDAMFCAVGMLAYIESRVPDLRTHSASMHIAALDRFLEMRHGMLSVELYGMLLRLSLWCDINPPLTVPPVSNPKASVDATSNVKLPIFSRHSDPTLSPSDVFDDIRRLVALREEYGCDPLPHGRDRERSLAYLELVSHRLHRTARSLPHSLLVSTAETIVLRCIRLGQILFMYTVSPAMSVSGVYSRSIADALRLCLEQTNPENGDAVYWSPEVLCWLLFNGAITNQAKVTQKWYFSRLREFLHSQSISHFDQVEVLLRKVCWLEDQFGVACRTLYRDLVLAVDG
ncbi:hypothetical protein PV08_09035 [Exophiala spinifera]|uniref:Transcription factor domain-containing protein n=1 Tax=Exophiala spinifera TaxID=91928 RepID=A0A0D2AYG9_9EURO|nr:uncharacterized protein PV08_09035 [Exophiala spinifera]KIW11763.1 hypothetical protein PV08_09035 [Exophiala spinifera]